MHKRDYARPRILSEKCFETSALSCGKVIGSSVPGSWHFSSAYDTFTGHLGQGFGTTVESQSGSAGVGFGPGGTSESYYHYGLCENWVTFVS